MSLCYKPTTAMARATPPTAHPVFPVIRGIPPELALLAAVVGNVLEPVELAVVELEAVEVCVTVLFDLVPVNVVNEAPLTVPEVEPDADPVVVCVEVVRPAMMVTAWY